MADNQNQGAENKDNLSPDPNADAAKAAAEKAQADAKAAAEAAAKNASAATAGVKKEGEGRAQDIPWFDNLPEAVKNLPQFAGIADAEGFTQRITDLLKEAGAPEAYTFEVPKGLETDDKVMDLFKDTAKKAGLSQKQASAIMDMWHGLQGQVAKSKADAYSTAEAQLQTEWGKDFEGRLNLAEKVVLTFGGKELSAFLKQSGLGNNIPLVKTFYEIAKVLGEDKLVTDGGNHENNEIERKNGMPMLTFTSMK